MREAGRIVYETHQFLKPYIKPGITTLELDHLAEKFIKSKGAIPSCKGYDGYPANICISVNEEIVHGIPSSRKLKTGDIVTLDICACFHGYHGDSGWTYEVGKISDDKKYLTEHTEQALYEGIKVAKSGVRVSDISRAIEEYANSHKLGIVRELVGHGIGSELHEEPDVPNYTTGVPGPILKSGMVIAIEPMLTLGSPAIHVLSDNWTVVTRDKSPSAHFEHTVLITDDGASILTKG